MKNLNNNEYNLSVKEISSVAGGFLKLNLGPIKISISDETMKDVAKKVAPVIATIATTAATGNPGLGAAAAAATEVVVNK